jgi:hypothetical protein
MRLTSLPPHPQPINPSPYHPIRHLLTVFREATVTSASSLGAQIHRVRILGEVREKDAVLSSRRGEYGGIRPERLHDRQHELLPPEHFMEEAEDSGPTPSSRPTHFRSDQ